jgi:hypothetical protein
MSSDYRLRSQAHFCSEGKIKSTEVTILQGKVLKQTEKIYNKYYAFSTLLCQRREPVFRNGSDHRKIRLIEGTANVVI